MSEKRKDSKGRLLRDGETQRPDGMYMFRYNDIGGVRRTIYSWRLVSSDKIPSGKRACVPLRDAEKKIISDINDGLETHSANTITLNEIVLMYIEMKPELSLSTRNNYIYIYNRFAFNSIGKMCIGEIKYSDVKKFYISMYVDKELSHETIKILNKTIKPALDLAVRDNYIRLNPAIGVFTEISKKFSCARQKRHALTTQQQDILVEFVKTSPKYKRWINLITVLLGTGCRIGEALGLQWDDCDFENNLISIKHTLVQCNSEDCKQRICYMSNPKTNAGIRIIPMLEGVRKALLNEKIYQMKHGFGSVEIDGYRNFVFTGRFGNIRDTITIDKGFRNIVKAYNKQETERAKAQRRNPILLPHFSAHTLRHTFCTRFCENETNLKVIQEIMGHADITTTMNVYSEATTEKKVASISSLEGKIHIG